MMEVKLLFRFMVVLYLFMAPNWCYAGRSRSPKNKHAVKSIKSPDGDIIDCVHISRQPAFDHPLLKNHTIKMRPSYHPNWIKDVNITSSKGKKITQLWHSNGKCPKGTIPIIRTNKEDALKYGTKKSSAFAYSTNPEVNSVNQNHEYALLRTKGLFYGAKATFNIWNPNVQENDEFSLTQLWIVAGPDSDLNSIEAGWQVYPGKYKDTTTKLFIFWTSDGYKKNMCYNLDCPGFIQTNNEFAIGASSLSPSQLDGSQNDITILIWKESKKGDWWMQLGDGQVIGYWPASLFSYLHDSSSRVDWGGEVINLGRDGHHTTTQMGSGHFPQEGYGKASYIRNIEIVDESITLRAPQDLITQTPQKSCYDIMTGINDKWGSHVFYGGPGQNQNCP